MRTMKRFLTGLLGVLLVEVVALTVTSCKACSKNSVPVDAPLVAHEVKPLALTPESIISTDRQAMFLRTPAGHTLHWMQTSITMTAFLTDESIGEATVMEVTNSFQTQWPADNGKGINTKVTLITTNTMATDSLVMKDSFYFDNYPLNGKQICLTFKDAVNRALQANCPKPQTRICVLRSPLGPVPVDDAFYIFAPPNGAQRPFIFVNARTGEVTTTNPAFKAKEDVP